MAADTDTNTGKRPRGRPPGSLNKITQAARLRAAQTGELPHEFLLRVARGELIQGKRVDEDGVVTIHYDQPDLSTRIDAAKAAAPYYAPKLATVELIQNVGDDELDQLIAESAAAAGFGLVAGGEGEEGEGPADADGGSGGSVRPRVRVQPR